MSFADDGSVASISPLLTDARIQSLTGLGDLLIYRAELATGVIVWTPALLRRWGYDVDATGQTAQWWLERTHPDDLAVVTGFLEEAIAGRRDEWELSYRFLLADGSWARVEGHARIVRDPSGHPVATEGVVRDVTHLYAVEQALRESESLFRMLTEHSRELVCRHDADGTYRYVSPAITELTQWTPEELLGRNPYEFFHPEDHARIIAESHALALRGDLDKVGIVYRFQCRDGNWIWLETLTRPLLDESGSVTGLQTSSRDVTDRRQLEERLVQAQKMDAIGMLASGVAHDFNNLLTVTSANLDLLLAETQDAHTYALLSESQTATTSAAMLTKQLMTLGRRDLPRREPVDVGVLLERLAPTLPRLGGARASLQMVATADSWVVGSPLQIEQLVLNLVTNARDALTEAGSIVVRAASVTLDEPYVARAGSVPPGTWMCLSVEDSGTGIPDAVLSHMFEPFFTTKVAGIGMGLGMSTVQAIVTDMGGHLTVATAEGEGTTVTCWFPLAPRPVAADPATRAAVAPDASTRSRSACRVLVVDDDPAVLKVAHRVLSTLGFNATAARGASEALSLIEQSGVPDVLLTDVMMPDMTGPELARRLQAEHPSLPIAFVSGYAREELLLDGMIGDEFPLVHKPFVAADLRAVVDRLCSRAASNNALAAAIE